MAWVEMWRRNRMLKSSDRILFGAVEDVHATHVNENLRYVQFFSVIKKNISVTIDKFASHLSKQ